MEEEESVRNTTLCPLLKDQAKIFHSYSFPWLNLLIYIFLYFCLSNLFFSFLIFDFFDFFWIFFRFFGFLFLFFWPLETAFPTVFKSLNYIPLLIAHIPFFFSSSASPSSSSTLNPPLFHYIISLLSNTPHLLFSCVSSVFIFWASVFWIHLLFWFRNTFSGIC